MKWALIAALDENRVIGNGNHLPWHLSEDLKRFRIYTQTHVLVMGRKTLDSIGKPLPNRCNVVLTTHPEQVIQKYKKDTSNETSLYAFSTWETIQQFLEQNEAHLLKKWSMDPVFVIGGQSVYEKALSFASLLYLTFVSGAYKGDAFFPKWEKKHFVSIFEEKRKNHCFMILRRMN